MPVQQYDALSGRVGRRFVHNLAVELTGFRQRHWKAERFIVFQTMIIQYARHVGKSCKIKQRINRRLDAWEVGEHEILAEDMSHT